MTHVFHRNPCATLPVATHGEGVYLYDNIGKKYLDSCGGAAVSCLGHNHPAPTKAIQAQAAKLAYVHTGFFTTDAAEELADKLASLAPSDINHAILVSGGSEAMETALKLARQYYVERGELSESILFRAVKAFMAILLEHSPLATTNQKRAVSPSADGLQRDCTMLPLSRATRRGIRAGVRIQNCRRTGTKNS